MHTLRLTHFLAHVRALAFDVLAQDNARTSILEVVKLTDKSFSNWLDDIFINVVHLIRRQFDRRSVLQHTHARQDVLD